MILLLVPVLCAGAGLALYAGLRATGAFGTVAGTSPPPARTYTSAPPSGLAERIQAIPSGWLVAVIALCGVWILGWLIVLAVGLNLLS